MSYNISKLFHVPVAFRSGPHKPSKQTNKPSIQQAKKEGRKQQQANKQKCILSSRITNKYSTAISLNFLKAAVLQNVLKSLVKSISKISSNIYNSC